MDIQIVVPVHDATRPIARAVTSVLAEPNAGVIVVAHNLDPAVLELPVDPRILIVQELEHPGRPGAAFDAGIAAADARWLGIMGSDDWYEPGALRALAARGDTDAADGVIVPLNYQHGSKGFNPRTIRTRNLQAARDGLFYRTAPLGLFRRDILQDPSFAFGTEFFVGEDLRVSVKLWTSGFAISHYPEDPAYVVGADARERTTLTPRPIAEQGAAWLSIWDEPMTKALNRKTRHALAVKVLRTHVLGALASRPTDADWKTGEFAWLSSLAQRVQQEDPRALAPFRKATARTLNALIAGDQSATLLHLGKEPHAGRLAATLPQSPTALFEKEAPPRWNLVGVRHAAKQRSAARSARRTRTATHLQNSTTDADSCPNLLIFSFSPIVNDARVLKQVRLFSQEYRVVTCGFGDIPPGSSEHIQLPSDLLPTSIDGRYITFHAYRAAYWRTPAIRNAWSTLRGKRFDAILANDIETVPIALRLKPTQGVHADLHEHYPSMHEYDPAWKRRIVPYMSWLLRKYVTRASSSTTVSSGLQRDYEERFGIQSGLVPNATPYADLKPTAVHNPIRLVHSGAGLRNRQLEIMLEAVQDTGSEVTIDLFLTKNDPKYLAELQERFFSEPRIVFRDPVPYADLVSTLNDYDVGVFVLPPRTFSYRWALPNKFFDFVQARLGILIGPSPEMTQYIDQHGNGAAAKDFTSAGLREQLDLLTSELVEHWKQASHSAAPLLAAERQSTDWERSIHALLFPRRG